MTFEYLPILYEGRKTSGHEQEELGAVLDKYAGQGWRLAHIIRYTETHSTLIFERERHAKDMATG